MRQDQSQPIALSVILPCFNASATIGHQLDALTAQRWDKRWEVIVADNGSTDASRTVAESYKDRLDLRVVDASDRKGASHARNVGASAARVPRLRFAMPMTKWLQVGWRPWERRF